MVQTKMKTKWTVMVARTAVRDGPVRSVVRIFFGPDFFVSVRGTDSAVRIFSVRSVVRIMRSGFFWSGPWSGFLVRISIGPVRGPDFRSGYQLVRSVSGFLVRIIRTGPDFRTGP